MVRNLAVISITWVAILAGCADTPQAAYSRMLEALVQFDPDAYVKTLTGSREQMDLSYASIDYVRSLQELKKKVIATRGPDEWAKFAELAGLGGEDTDDDKAGPPVSVPAVASQPADANDEDEEEPTFLVEGDTARVLEADKDTGSRLVRIDGRWYFDISSDDDCSLDYILLTATAMYRKLAEGTRNLAREFDSPKFDPEQAARSYGSFHFRLALEVNKWADLEYQMRQALAEGKPKFPWVFYPSELVREIRQTRPSVYFTIDGIAWGSDKTPITIKELSARLEAMNLRGKLPSERWVIVMDAKGRSDDLLLEALRAMTAAGALPMATFDELKVKIPTPGDDEKSHKPK